MQRVASRFPELQSDEGFWDTFHGSAIGIAVIPVHLAEVAPDRSYALALISRIQRLGGSID